MDDLLRVYLDRAEFGLDGYPRAWHKIPEPGVVREGDPSFIRLGIKDLIREQAGHRCVRCCHPYRSGEHGNGEWSPCDENCTHPGPGRWRFKTALDKDWLHWAGGESPPWASPESLEIEAQWRILTVHHLNGIKHDCRWWNLVALCQRCHLSIQTRVVMERPWDKPHSEWFRPYVAGYYTWADHGLELTREETLPRIDELLGPHLLQHTLEGLF